jgi:secretion/DNA translocation related TadE-like protein
MLCCVLLVVGLSFVVLVLGAALVSRHRASVVADLAALAGADALLAGRPSPCLAAARVGRAQDGRVVECRVVAGVVEVVAEVPVGELLAFLPPARARARAGGHDAGQ